MIVIAARVVFTFLVLIFTSFSVNAGSKDTLSSLTFDELLSVEVGKGGQGVFVSGSYDGLNQPINIGLVLPVSKYPTYSTELIAAADSAAEIINKHGGILGRPIAIIRGDDASNNDMAMSVTKELLDDFNAQVLIGPVESDRAQQVAEQLTLPNDIPLIAPTASMNQLVENNSRGLVYRLIASNAMQGEAIAKHIAQQSRHKKVIVIRTKHDYDIELTNEIIDSLNKKNGKVIEQIVLSRLVNYKEYNMKPVIQTLKNDKPQTVIVILPQFQAVQVLEHIEQANLSSMPLFITADLVKPTPIINADLPEIKKCLSMVIAESQRVDYNVFKQVSEKLNLDSTTYDSAYFFDSVFIMAYAKIYAQLNKVSFDEAILKITADGIQLTPDDFHRFPELATKHTSFQFDGASGRTHLNNNGHNVAASLYFWSPETANKPLRKCGKANRQS